MAKPSLVPRRKGRIIRVLLLLILIVSVAIAVSLWMHRVGVEQQVQMQEQYRDDTIAELERGEGTYDAQSIVLYDTSRVKAERLADKLGASLRITEDGSFATLTLPEGTSILDVYRDEDNLPYLEQMSADWQVKISDREEDKDNDKDKDKEHGPRGDRLPMRPTHHVSDPGFAMQGYLDYMNMQHLMGSYTGFGITVAVIDTGIDTDHPEFVGRISEYSYNATEDKIVKDYLLEDGSYDWSLVEDEQGHGTAVSGVIAAGANGIGTVGIAPQVNLIVIKAECDEKGTFARISDLVFGLYYAIERDASIVNMSFGVYHPENPFAAATKLAVDSDIICVAAAGNSSLACPIWPAADKNVFGIGALAADSWELATYSNYGENVDFVAPGTTYTTCIGGGYATKSGTSFSCPATAGVIALYLSANSYQEFAEVEELLRASSYDLGEPGADWYYGYGAIDAHALIAEQRGTVTFHMMTDELDNTEQVFIRNHTLQNMPQPERLYAIFDGWYCDPGYTDEFTWYEDVLTADRTLYAKWVNEDDGVPYTYAELEDGTIEIRSYTGHRRYITIPDYIDGKPVSSIGTGAFAYETNLREVNLPKHLVRIGDQAFVGCSNLIKMEIPDTVTEIGKYAFCDNVRLSSVAFGQDSQLTAIGTFAFSGCGHLKYFHVPRNVASLDGSAFFGDTSMLAFSVHEENQSFFSQNGVLFNRAMTTAVAYPAGRNGEFALPASVYEVGDYAFALAKITQVDFSNVQVIGPAAYMSSDLEAVIIPDNVTQMGGRAFFRCEYLTTLHIGYGIAEIPDGAFSYCYALQSVMIPNTVQSIGGGAFGNASLHEGLTFEKDSTLVYIGRDAFRCTNIGSVEIPASVVMIDERAFLGSCGSSLSSVVFEQGSALRVIDESAFEKTPITEITLPARLESIGPFAFAYTNLQAVTLPQSVSELGGGAFAFCPNLDSIYVEYGNPVYTDLEGVVYSIDMDMLVAYPTGNSRAEYTVPDGVTKIGESAFCGTMYMSGIQLPESLEEIRSMAFLGCQNLYSVAIPDNVVQIGRLAFAEDRQLRSVTFGEDSKLPRISYESFAFCGLYSFRVPANVSTMAQGAFIGCDDLTSFTFAGNSKLESISAYMFDGCTKLQTVTFEQGSALTSIQAHGFQGMTKLTTLDLGGASLTNIDNYAFLDCESLQSLTLPDTLTNIGRFAFYNCASLSELTIPALTEHIGSYAFYGTKNCSLYFKADELPLYLDEYWDHSLQAYYTGVVSVKEQGDWKYATKTNGNIAIIKYFGKESVIDLSKLKLGGKIETVGGHAFEGCGITSITLPDSLLEIQRYAFADTKHLSSVIIPKNVRYVADHAFAGSGIASLTFWGGRINVIEAYAFAYTDNLKSVELPDSLTKLGSYAFHRSGIESLQFGEHFSLTKIPEAAFSETKLTSVKIPDSVTEIGYSAFRDTRTLTQVELGRGENLIISSNAFYNTGISKIYIPDNVAHVGEYALIGLENLTAYEVSSENKTYTAVDGVLYNKDKTKIIAFPAGRTGSYEIPACVESIGFGAFENTKLSSISFAQDINLLTIGWRAFYNAENLTEITIPASVVSIDYYAFASCKNLTTVDFATNDSLKGIYEGAFFGCQRLEHITLPDSVVEISDYAFYGCMSLQDIPVSAQTQLKGIYDHAFAYAGLTELTIPETLIDIGSYAFQGSRVTQATVPDTNAWDLVIGIGAFADCNQMEEITVPFIGASFEDKEITWFGYIFGAGGYEANATYVPTSLKRVVISEGITFVGTGAFYSKEMVYIESSGSYVGTCGHNIEELVLPKSIISVGKLAFADCTASFSLGTIDKIDGGNDEYTTTFSRSGIKAIAFGDGVTKISRYTFRECDDLRSIHIPKTLVDLDEKVMEYVIFHAFSQCSAHITVDQDHPIYEAREKVIVRKDTGRVLHTNAVGGIEDYIDTEDGFRFTTDGKLIAYLGDERVVKLPTDFFGEPYQIYRLTGVKHVIVPEGITTIDAYAFENCGTLESIELPKSVTSIGDGAFMNCHELKTIRLSENLTSIGRNAFFNCYALTEIDIPDSVQTIGSAAFYDCRNLTSVQLPRQLKKIEGQMFSGCICLSDIMLPESIVSLGNNAFSNCLALKTIRIPKNVQTLQGAFTNCRFEDFSIDPDNPYLHEENGILYNADKTKIVGALEGVTEIVIPNSVIDIRLSGVQSIEKVTFEEGSKMTHVSSGAFSGCVSLTTVILPNSITSINSSAFERCTSLTSIRIPPNVTCIDSYAFNLCQSIYAVYNESDLEITLGTSDFGKIAANAVLVVDKDGTKHYKVKDDGTVYIDTADGFLFKKLGETYTLIAYIGDSTKVTLPVDYMGHTYNIYSMRGVNHVVFPWGHTHVDGSAFISCYSLKSVEIPESVTELGSAAFYYCQNLSQVTLDANIDEIQSSTFAGCLALTDITIPASVKKIGMRAFEECSKLDTIILLSQNIEQIGQNAFSQTQYSKDLSNWENGVLKLGELVIGVDSQNENIMIKSDAIIAPDAFENCYKLKNLSLGGDYISLLAPLSNIETLIIQKMPSHPISFYFGRSPSVPLTLNKIVLCKGVNVYQQSFEKITGITIFVEGSKEDCPWDKVYPGWNNGNRVIYGDDWYLVSYYDADGTLLSTHQYTTNEVIKPPHLYSHTDKQDAYVFMGWDADGDGIADALPATLNRDYELRAVYQKTEAQYRVEYMDQDGKTVLHSYLLLYGAEIPTVADPVKKGYTFIGWSRIPATVTEDVRIYSEWRHTGNGHEYQTSVVEPSCTVDGYTLHTCSVCDESYKTDVIKATGHNFGDWEVTRKADCKKQGSMYRECACGQKETQVIERTPHEYVETHRVESTCKQPGKLTLSCKHCNDKAKSDLPLRQHEYQEKHAKRHALDSFLKKYDKLMYGMRGDDEIYYYECSGCNRVRTHENERSQSHGAAGVMSVGCAHVPSDWQILIAPTCAEYGANVQACTLCQEVLDVQLVENNANSHISADAVEEDRKEPTCTETGGYDSVVYCINCGEELGREHVEIPANGHTSADIVIENRVEPTCTEHGSCDNVTYCSACDAELSREHVVLDAIGHNHNATVTAPTCTEQGYTTYTCHCGDVYVDHEVEALGHTPSDWITDTEPQIGVSGSKHKACTACGEILETATMDALTEAPTTEEPTTEEPTTDAPITDAPSTDTPTTDAEGTEQSTEPKDEGGCNGSLSAAFSCMMLIAFAAVAVTTKKKY